MSAIGASAASCRQALACPSCRPTVHRGDRLVAWNRKGSKKTQAVLTTNVPNVGLAGDLVAVQTGYMYNYLFPQRLAQPATKEILEEIQAKLDAAERAKAEEKAKAKAMATALQTIGVIRIPKKVGEQQQIFGSVKPKEITDYIERQTSRQLDPRSVTLPEMKSLGTYEASIRLHPEVTGYFKVQVTKQSN